MYLPVLLPLLLLHSLVLRLLNTSSKIIDEDGIRALEIKTNSSTIKGLDRFGRHYSELLDTIVIEYDMGLRRSALLSMECA